MSDLGWAILTGVSAAVAFITLWAGLIAPGWLNRILHVVMFVSLTGLAAGIGYWIYRLFLLIGG